MRKLDNVKRDAMNDNTFFTCIENVDSFISEEAIIEVRLSSIDNKKIVVAFLLYLNLKNACLYRY